MHCRIRSVECFPLNYPVRGRFKFFSSAPGKAPSRASVLVRITGDDGTTGWGQSVPSHRWSYETVESVCTTLEHYLGPALIGLDAFDADTISATLHSLIAPSFSTGQPLCKAGIDLALFDLTGRLTGQRACERLGPHSAGSIDLSWTLNPESLETAAASITEAHVLGYRHFNVKVAPDLDWDLELCRLIRERAPQAVLWADANGGYDTETALKAAPKFAALGVSFLEQPVPANCLSGFAALKQQGALPIIMDEGLVSVTDLREFHTLGLLDGAAIKVSRCGGLTEAKRQVDYLIENDLIFLGSGLTDPDLSLAASLALFGANGLKFPAALNGPQFITGSVLSEPLIVRSGSIAPASGPGLGVSVDTARLESWPH